MNIERIPQKYQALAVEHIIYNKENNLGKAKYNDKTYHTSSIMKYYVEKNFSKKNAEKNLINVHKKIKKNKKYQLTLKDLILLESLQNDGFVIPKEINQKEVSKNNPPPIELLNLVKNKEIGLVLLRIIELIGEDEILDLDTQTIYFINHLFVQAKLTKLRNRILITVLPDRTKI